MTLVGGSYANKAQGIEIKGGARIPVIFLGGEIPEIGAERYRKEYLFGASRPVKRHAIGRWHRFYERLYQGASITRCPGPG